MSAAKSLSQVARVDQFKVDQYDEILSTIQEQHKFAKFKAFSADTAFELGSKIRELFLKNFDPKELGIIIKIETFGGHLLFASVVGNSGAVAASNWSVHRHPSTCIDIS